MIIHSTLGVSFTCPKCNTFGKADRPSDLTAVCCNGQEHFYIECPICGEKIPVENNEIPVLFLPRIKRIVTGLAFHD